MVSYQVDQLVERRWHVRIHKDIVPHGHCGTSASSREVSGRCPFRAGVTEGADCWWVRFEADIHDGSLFVTALTATEALDKARSEAISRIPH